MSKRLFLLLMGLLVLLQFVYAQTNSGLWQLKTESEIDEVGPRRIIPNVYSTFQLDTLSFKNLLGRTSAEGEIHLSESEALLSVPLPEGDMLEFKILLYDMMEPGLSARFPEIKTAYGISTGKDVVSIRLDWTYHGFHAKVRHASGMIFIDPYSLGDKLNYVVYYKKDYPAPEEPFVCHVENEVPESTAPSNSAFNKAGDCVFRSYRLAVATTGEYSNYHGGTKPSVLSEIATAVNRLNEVYEFDHTIRMELIANNDDVIYLNASTDPFSNGNTGTMINQNQTNMTDVIGAANYDIGHVFGTGGGGLAQLRVPCKNNKKAKGVTCLNPPTGDPFYIDYVAHEMGHQFGANHTQNNDCNHVAGRSMEPGSASTIMGYAGICSPNVQQASDDYFHGISIEEIADYVSYNQGDNCDTPLSFPNNAPTVSAGGDYTIPVSTPFVLTADADDQDGDPIFYCWEQWDPEWASMPPDPISDFGPMFRTFEPKLSPKRYFPNLDAIVNNVSPIWEVLPSEGREMEFRVTVRDLVGTAGCTAEDNVDIVVDDNSGPFLVTAPNTAVSFNEGENTTVSWNVEGTNSWPVSCANVDILLSYDGGYTYPVTLASGVPNDGDAPITIPMGTSMTARIMVMCSDNIFFDISDVNFTILPGLLPDYTLDVFPLSVSACQNEKANFIITVGSTGGYSDPVNLSVSGLPPGIVFEFSLNPVNPGGSTNLTITNLSATSPGAYPFTIQGSSTAGNRFANATLEVLGSPASINLSSPLQNEIDVSIFPTFSWQADPLADSYHLMVAADPGFLNVVADINTNDNFYTLTTELEPISLYYWRVVGFSGTCLGTWSASHSFLTYPCMEFSNESSLPIPTSGTVFSYITLGQSGDAGDINVTDLSGTHSRVGDLTVNLRSPDGTLVNLF